MFETDMKISYISSNSRIGTSKFRALFQLELGFLQGTRTPISAVLVLVPIRKNAPAVSVSRCAQCAYSEFLDDTFTILTDFSI